MAYKVSQPVQMMSEVLSYLHGKIHRHELVLSQHIFLETATGDVPRRLDADQQEQLQQLNQQIQTQ
jgi:hypothetical protein